MDDRQTIPRTRNWLDSAGHKRWLDAEGDRLLGFYRASRRGADGFGALDALGHLPADAPADTMITARMTHSYAIAAMRGIPGCLPLAAHGVQALAGVLRDHEYGGWYSQWPLAEGDDHKYAYLQAFVALAAASAMLAGVGGASALLDDSVEQIERHFWDSTEGRLHESFSRDWQHEEAYRGGNSNMHGVEAMLALADALVAPQWHDRALCIARHLVHDHAAAHGYLVVEHFHADWREWPEYNRDKPADGFRPFGFTPGHAFEWSRLLLHLEAGLASDDRPAPTWLLEDAKALFASGARYGWNVDGAPGIVYTVDWDKQPLVHSRMHWTLAEASASAAALYQRTGEVEYERWYARVWDYIATYLIDREAGSWWHELDRHNTPASGTWSGKPDLYHAYQATLLPQLPLSPTIAAAVAKGLVSR